MSQKIFKTGNNLAVSLPIEKIETIGLTEGSEISIIVDENLGQIILKPLRPQTTCSSIEFAQELNDFIAEYGSALEALEK